MMRIKLYKHRTKTLKQAWYFTIVARNGEVLATSEKYTNKDDAVFAANVLIAGMQDAFVEEIT